MCGKLISKNCRFLLDVNSKTLTKKNISDLLTKKETATIKGFKSKKGILFSAKLKVKESKLEFILENKK